MFHALKACFRNQSMFSGEVVQASVNKDYGGVDIKYKLPSGATAIFSINRYEASDTDFLLGTVGLPVRVSTGPAGRVEDVQIGDRQVLSRSRATGRLEDVDNEEALIVLTQPTTPKRPQASRCNNRMPV